MNLITFIRSMPQTWADTCDPSVVYDDDGEFNLDWDFGKGNMVNVGITNDGSMTWAARVDGKSVAGSSKNTEEIPAEIVGIFKAIESQGLLKGAK